jgi:hypothetical protein
MAATFLAVIALPQKSEKSFLDTVSTGSGSDLVNDGVKNH